MRLVLPPLLAPPVLAASNVFDVTDFGAVGDGTTKDTEAVRAAAAGRDLVAPPTVLRILAIDRARARLDIACSWLLAAAVGGGAAAAQR